MVGVPEKRDNWFGANKKDGIRKGAVSFLENLDVGTSKTFLENLLTFLGCHGII
jgi:hypothetical protein